jgi:hypothetical protein
MSKDELDAFIREKLDNIRAIEGTCGPLGDDSGETEARCLISLIYFTRRPVSLCSTSNNHATLETSQGQLCGVRNISVWTPFAAELKFPNLDANRTDRRQHRIDKIVESPGGISPPGAPRTFEKTRAAIPLSRLVCTKVILRLAPAKTPTPQAGAHFARPLFGGMQFRGRVRSRATSAVEQDEL